MKMISSYEKSGGWLFRYRSFLPLLAAPLFIAGLRSFEYIDHSHFKTELWGMVCLFVSLLGLAVRFFSVGSAPRGTSGRNTKSQKAETLNTTGIYSIMRHPLYLGNYLGMLGFCMFFRNLWLVLLATCLFALYYERIMFAEEAFLSKRFGDIFENWAAVTPSIFPRMKGWVSPQHSFSWRTGLRREYTGFFLVIGGFAILDTVADSIHESRWHVDFHWAIAFAGASVVYLVLRSIKKYSDFLHVEGR